MSCVAKYTGVCHNICELNMLWHIYIIFTGCTDSREMLENVNNGNPILIIKKTIRNRTS